MRIVIRTIVIGMLVMFLSACATLSTGSKARVKCPSCGYEFEIQDKGR